MAPNQQQKEGPAGQDPFRAKHTALIALALTLVAFATLSDSWPGPTVISAISPDGNRIVRVEPGESVGDTFGFAGAAKGPFAQATYYERDAASDTFKSYLHITLQNPVAPVDVLLNDGGVLATLDNWHNIGYGSIVVIFDQSGRIVADFELEKIYTKEQVTEIPHSVSSRWWRCATNEPVINDASLWITDNIGGQFKFNLADGSFEYSQERDYCPGD